jgi:DNA-binding transcriptional MerR regulator
MEPAWFPRSDLNERKLEIASVPCGAGVSPAVFHLIHDAQNRRRDAGATGINMEDNGQNESALPDKDLFRIGEVSRMTGTKQFVLRYWESEFPMLQPVKSPKGHRLYRREDIDTVFVIKRLLYDEGFTIAGARRHLRDQPAESSGVNGEAPATNVGSTFTSNVRHNEDYEQSASSEESSPAGKRHAEQLPAGLSRKTLLDLRDSLRSFLTLLEHE